MDIVLGVSMTPTTVRMVLVEGEKADGITVDHDAFDVASGDASATAAEQVVTAILGTRESATEGGHRLVSTGVTWRDHDEAAALRDALAARNIDNVMLVSELHAAGALAQAVGRIVGYDRTALMFLERDTATLSVVQTSDGSIVKVESQDLHTDDAVVELTAMVAGLEHLENPPQGVFVVGSGVSAAAIKLQLESATSLPVSAPEESELALARGAGLASAAAPLFEASTVGLGSVEDTDTQMAAAGYMAAPASLAYSEVIDGPLTGGFGAFVNDSAGEVAEPAVGKSARNAPAAPQPGRKPFLLVGSAMTSIFVLGVTALVVSLAVSIRPTVDQRPSPAESVIVPTEAPAAPVVKPEAALPAVPAPPPETIPAPRPVVQEAPPPQAPRTVFVEAPAPAAIAPVAIAPAAPAPVPAPIVAPVYTPPPVAPYIPPPVIAPEIPPLIVLPKTLLPPFLRPQYEQPQQQWPQQPQQQPVPQQQWPQQPQQQWPVPQQQWPQQPQQQWPVPQQQPQQQWPQQSGSGRGSGSGDYGSGGDSGRGSGRGSGGGSGSGSGGSSIWPWPIFGNH